MDWQEPVALGVVVLTVALMLGAWVRGRMRAGRGEGGHGCACGCPGSEASAAAPRITYRIRKGGRPTRTVHDVR